MMQSLCIVLIYSQYAPVPQQLIPSSN